MEESEIYNVSRLIEDLKHEDIQNRINAINKLNLITDALGPERTRTDFIPFLQELIDDDDEVLAALAESLGQLIDAVGGPEYASGLLPLLENLAAVEDATVRDKSVDSLCKIANVLSEQQLVEDYMPLLKRLSLGEWFTCRTSATGLFATIYSKCSKELQDELKQIFKQLVEDDSPMVRRAAAKALGKFSTQVSIEDVFSTVLPLFQILSQDDQDSVRLLAVENFTPFASFFSNEQKTEQLLPIFKRLTEDKSWRVRYMIASNY
ncbi:hypothetical protein BJ944DRAFT_159465, partial [Cunninghamella echinulata]